MGKQEAKLWEDDAKIGMSKVLRETQINANNIMRTRLQWQTLLRQK